MRELKYIQQHGGYHLHHEYARHESIKNVITTEELVYKNNKPNYRTPTNSHKVNFETVKVPSHQKIKE